MDFTLFFAFRVLGVLVSSRKEPHTTLEFILSEREVMLDSNIINR